MGLLVDVPDIRAASPSPCFRENPVRGKPESWNRGFAKLIGAVLIRVLIRPFEMCCVAFGFDLIQGFSLASQRKAEIHAQL